MLLCFWTQTCLYFEESESESDAVENPTASPSLILQHTLVYVQLYMHTDIGLHVQSMIKIRLSCSSYIALFLSYMRNCLDLTLVGEIIKPTLKNRFLMIDCYNPIWINQCSFIFGSTKKKINNKENRKSKTLSRLKWKTELPKLTWTSKVKYFFMFLMIITKKGSLMPSVFFSSFGAEM